MIAPINRPMHHGLALLVGLLLCASTALAQKGSIVGVVVDAETGETLIGANVVLEGTTVGSTTDLGGHYEIEGVDPGTYDVVYSYIGFNTRTVRNVEVRAGEATQINVNLAPEAVGLEEVVVEAAAVRNTEGALLRERARAAALSDAISAEAISRSGSSDAADAMEKVTGASVVGGKYVYVRGLGDRYMSTQLNGAILPSADPDRNTVPLDLFPAAALDNIVTTKSFTPDKPGSFAGGNINISTRAFPESFRFSISTGVSYNTEVSGSDRFLTYDGGGVGLLAFNTENHRIPEAWRNRPPDAPPVLDVQARFDEEKAAELDELAKAFTPTMAPVAATAPMNRSLSISTGNQVRFLGRPLGFLGGISYDNSHSFYVDGAYGEYKLTGVVSQKEELTPQAELREMQGTEEVLLGGLGTVSYKLTPEHILSSTFIYNRSGESAALLGVGALQRDLPASTTFETRAMGYTERGLQSLQFSGEHYFRSLGGLRAEWTTAATNTMQEEPDLRFFANQFDVRERNGRIDTVYAIRASNYTTPSRYWRELEEDAWDSSVDLSLPFGRGAGINGTLKTGGAYNTRERTFREQLFVYQLNPSVAPYGGDPHAFFSEQTGVLDTTVTAGGHRRFTIGNYIQNASTPANNYDGDQQIYATYGMIDLRLLPRLRVITGVRFEATRMAVESLDETLPAGELDNNDWLPSLNLVYQLQNNMNLRAAYGRTLARPIFREKAPYASFDFIGGRIFVGNPELERTLVDNLDLRWEWFTRPGEIFAVSGFYKRMENPIELAIISTNNQVQYQNVDRATIYGAEFEFRQRLDYLARALTHVEVGGNLSLVHSQVDIPADDLEEIRALDPDADDQRPLQGQSPFVLNLDLTYFNPQVGTTASLVYNLFGARLSEVSIGGSPNVYEQPAPMLDLVVTQPLMAGFRMKVSAKNLLDSEYRRTQAFKGQAYVVHAYERGRTFSVGVTYAIE